MVEWQEWQPADDPESQPPPPTPMEEGALLQHTPHKGGGGHRNSLTPSRPLKSPLWDIEVCTPTQDLKRQRLHTAHARQAQRGPAPPQRPPSRAARKAPVVPRRDPLLLAMEGQATANGRQDVLLASGTSSPTHPPCCMLYVNTNDLSRTRTH